jgi:hypothetical protein
VLPGRVLAVAGIAGALWGLLSDVSAAHALALSVATMSVAIAIDERATRRALVLFALAAASASHAAVRREAAIAPPLAVRLAGMGPAPLDVVGTVVRDAEVADAGVRMLVDVHRLQTPRGSELVQGRVQVYVSGTLAAARVREWRAGRVIRAPMTFKAPAVWLNPGTPDLAWQRLTARAQQIGTVKSAALVSVERGAWWREWCAAARGARGRAPPDRGSLSRDAAVCGRDRRRDPDR